MIQRLNLEFSFYLNASKGEDCLRIAFFGGLVLLWISEDVSLYIGVNDMDKTFENILEIEGINAKGFGTIAKLVMIDQRLTIESKAIYSYFCLCWYGIQCISKCQ